MGPRRWRRVALAGAGFLLLGGALWLRFAWAPQALGSRAELAGQYLRIGSEAALARRFTDAAAAFQRATELDPRRLEAWISLASARADGQDRAGALAALARAERLAPDSAEVAVTRARIDLAFGDYGAARAAAERAVALAPDDPHGHVLLGLAIAERISDSGDAALAEQHAKRALALGYRGPEPFYTLGWVEWHRGRIDAAIRALEVAVERDPRSPRMRYRLARAYQRAGRHREAERALAEFRRLTEAAPAAAPPGR